MFSTGPGRLCNLDNCCHYNDLGNDILSHYIGQRIVIGSKREPSAWQPLSGTEVCFTTRFPCALNHVVRCAAPQQVGKSRVGTQRIEYRIDFKIDEVNGALLICLVEPLKRFILAAQFGIDFRYG